MSTIYIAAPRPIIAPWHIIGRLQGEGGGGGQKGNKTSKQRGGPGGAFISPSSANLYFIALSICLLLLQMILHARSTFRWFKSYFLFPFQQLLLVNSISTETTSNSNQFLFKSSLVLL